MIKGCQKKVIWIRNTESELFDQAYFILSDAAQTGSKTENDIIKEAKQIIARSPVKGYWGEETIEKKTERSRASQIRRLKILFFAFGCAVGAIPPIALLLIL